MNKLISKVNNLKENGLSSDTKAKIRGVGLALATLPFSAPMQALADGYGDTASMAGGIVKILGYILTMLAILGVVFMVMGLTGYIMAQREQNPEGQGTAAKNLAVGATLVIFRMALWPSISTILEDMIKGGMSQTK